MKAYGSRRIKIRSQLTHDSWLVSYLVAHHKTGVPDPENPFHHILPMKEAPWYTEDLFGLRTADESGKNHFESFVGDHLRFTLEDFDRWITTYFKD